MKKKKIKHIGLGQTPTLSEQKLIWFKVVINQPKMTISDIGNMLIISPIYWGVIIADDSVLQCCHKPGVTQWSNDGFKILQAKPRFQWKTQYLKIIVEFYQSSSGTNGSFV